MRKKLNLFLLFVIILLTDIALGKSSNKTKSKTVSLKHSAKLNNERIKRSLDDDDENPFWPNRGKKELYSKTDLFKEPFWATRGRRDSSSQENFLDTAQSSKINSPMDENCEIFFKSSDSTDAFYGNIKHAREDVMSPFWGNRGRRSSKEIDDNDIPDDLFWGSRGRRQEQEPFWGMRGRRQPDEPFWGNRGRRDDEPFWGNRGRRQEEPFWGNRGRRENNEPFWGNRGRPEGTEPFWGNRGRRDDDPFWGNRGRRKESEPFWSSRGRRKQDLKESILKAINVVQDDINHLSRLRRSENENNSFWANRSRNSKLKNMFNEPSRSRLQPSQGFHKEGPYGYNPQSPEPGTVLDNRIYAEEPHYIIVERNSRSSGEDDPFYISRGKKYYVNFDVEKATRGRRGAIEEIVKSVRNDPYYIARGKKDPNFVKIGNVTMAHEEFVKAKELICATVEMIMVKGEKTKSKRDVDNERDRRTILKKLAAQLQMDPYFVSRGKKSDESHNNDDNLEDFINEVAGKCN